MDLPHKGNFEVFGETPISLVPGEVALDDPAPGLDGEVNLIGFATNDFDGDQCSVRYVVARVRCRESLFDERKDGRDARESGTALSRSWMIHLYD